MKKWIWRAIVLTILGYVGFAAYDLKRRGYFSLPELADNEYPISFTSGFRAIVPLPEDLRQMTPTPKLFRRLAMESPDRQYLGVPVDVPDWMQDKWSRCVVGSEAENADVKKQIELTMPEKLRSDLIGARLDAVCGFAMDDGTMRLRGYIYSIPRL